MKLKRIISAIVVGSLLVMSHTAQFSALTVQSDNFEFSVIDATNVQKYVVGMIDLTDDQKSRYDINGDNMLTVIDATNIQKILVGLQPDTCESTTGIAEPTTSVYTEETTDPTDQLPSESTTETITQPSTDSIEPPTEEVTEPTTVLATSVPTGISINKSEIVLGISEIYALNVIVKNGNISQVAFTTSNSNVAVVDNNGKITAVGVGSATIVAKTYNGLKAECKVTVKKLADSIKLNKTSITLGIGEQYDFFSSIPSNTAAYFRFYYSDNENVASIQKAGGLMTAKKAGTTTIRCQMQNGTEATCKVTVRPLATSVTCTLNNGAKAVCNVYIMPQSKKISNAPLIGQSKLPTGCETCSATMLLNFYGYTISETTFADKYLTKKPFGYSNGSYTGPDPNCAFVGTPYSSNSYGAYAPIMAKCMNKYLSDKSYKAIEISGKSLEYLSGKYVAQGQPIMVWATINMSPSFKTTTWKVNYTDENAKYKLGSYYTWIAGEHCLLLTGYDNDYYYFNDPWTNARTRYSKSIVNSRYNELGKQAVVMVKK